MKIKHKTARVKGWNSRRYFAGRTTTLLVALVLVINARKLVHMEGNMWWSAAVGLVVRGGGGNLNFTLE
ncbi:hypothetical protein C5167_031649 [Papaver somniferum]|uniref:Uncharacterized protein n=1 Tax=Papaver somniferum TaxID=3469 RepID=A0A4Y7K7R1_PAPSO|nr:hypothetical protein C5167_031649 [Papaver somniferum]